ncbi:MAG: DUF3108 domain-containing protein [Planctomycetota bacterium]
MKAADEPAQEPEVQRRDDLRIDWSENADPLYVPRGEKLVFRVRVGVGGIDAPVGDVTMECGTEPYRESVLLLGASSGEAERESAWMRLRAKGDYQLFSMDAKVESHLHPVDWPRAVYNFQQTGSKNRRREVLIGRQGGEPFVRYRRDSDRNAPKGTRIWKDPKERVLPVDALDMVSAAYYARSMAREDRLYLSFPVADKLDLWEIRLRRGKEGKQETYAGTFDAVQILLDPRPYPGEVPDDKTREKAETFEGLFGIHGSIELWVERQTGVPVRIRGDLPVGPLDLEIDVLLKSFSGTPPAFRPLPE